MNLQTRLGLLAAFALGSLAGCAGSGGQAGDSGDLGDIGAACELEEHCADGLICDFHGEYGSCQEPHDH